jgi:predicted DNA-binding protein (UPF0251 family)
MARPCKCRRIGFQPDITYYKPAGIPLSSLQTIMITFDEMEAIRLADLEKMYQEEAAVKMSVSRQTFGNIINRAHNKIAQALIIGKSIRIEGGNVQMTKRKFVCDECKHEWEIPFGSGRPLQCPRCHSNLIYRSPDDRGGFGSRARNLNNTKLRQGCRRRGE